MNFTVKSNEQDTGGKHHVRLVSPEAGEVTIQSEEPYAVGEMVSLSIERVKAAAAAPQQAKPPARKAVEDDDDDE